MLVIRGATGQSKVLKEFLIQHYQVRVEDEKTVKTEKGDKYFIIAIAKENRGELRHQLHQEYKKKGLKPKNAIHPKSYIARDATYGEGLQIMANATICTNAKVGDCVIVNTGAIIEHDCVVGNGVHVAPNSTVLGECFVGDYSFIGAGAVVLPRRKIGKHVIVGAGAVVTKDVPDGVTVAGVPAKTKNRIFKGEKV